MYRKAVISLAIVLWSQQVGATEQKLSTITHHNDGRIEIDASETVIRAESPLVQGATEIGEYMVPQGASAALIAKRRSLDTANLELLKVADRLGTIIERIEFDGNSHELRELSKALDEYETVLSAVEVAEESFLDERRSHDERAVLQVSQVKPREQRRLKVK